jgi:hypothetical protein
MIADEFERSPWPEGEGNSVGVMPTLRACGARPSAGAIQAGMASRGKPGANAEGGFLGGTHSVRPLGKAGRKPTHCIPTGTFTMSRRSRGGNVRARLTRSLRACGARPSRGASQGETA